MKKEIKYNNKNISIYYDDLIYKNDIQVFILNTFDEDAKEILNEIKKITNKKFVLAIISNIDWNSEMSPWYMDKLYKNDHDYSGHASEYIDTLTNDIVPLIDKEIIKLCNVNVASHVLVGYSLAGLFAIYSLFKTNVFDSVISCSGSMWYPNFIDFINNNELKIIPKKVYLSLGDKESKTRNELLATVFDKTKEVEAFFKSKNVKTIFELNEGNHFMNESMRIAKGIAWILDGE